MLMLNIFWLPVKVNRDDGFHLDLEDYLMGLLQLASELVGHSSFYLQLTMKYTSIAVYFCLDISPVL